MERLTTTNKDVGREMICRNEDCGVTEEHCPHLMEDECYCLREVINKLAKYEDLEEQCITENQCGIRELLLKWKEFFDDIAELYDYRKAEEQGLLLRLPAAVGSKFWYLNGKFILDFVVTGYHVCEKIEEGIIYGEHYNEYDDKTYCHSFDVDKIGKTVFLTREEAETALAEKGGA